MHALVLSNKERRARSKTETTEARQRKVPRYCNSRAPSADKRPWWWWFRSRILVLRPQIICHGTQEHTRANNRKISTTNTYGRGRGRSTTRRVGFCFVAECGGIR
ncbi:uncharacterized protein LOC112341789 [Selaginella moellendorffii]|uniref:uncharacterized protein LOC112341789 n=1 Tax=Selaginella moellendorffii TaxID=88036 RepID=UPI000D1C3C20|nr:uncharacterized protein LOC112341789 [Selaginella moellendorffii]|eukprot:XP_024518299.1 uncharacterized protein LOC112341789 [Selaginella moellendorffii]